MKIISLIHEPGFIKHILHHLGFWKQPPDPHDRKLKAPEDGPLVMRDFELGWPGYEEPVIIYH